MMKNPIMVEFEARFLTCDYYLKKTKGKSKGKLTSLPVRHHLRTFCFVESEGTLEQSSGS